MKTALNVLAIGVCVVWGGLTFLEDFGRAFGNAPPQLQHGEVGVAVVSLVALATLASVIASRFTEGNRAWALAALPFALVALGHAFLGYRLSSAHHARDSEQRSRERIAQLRFDRMPRDFRYHGSFGEYADQIDSILVIDRQTQSLVRVDNERTSLLAFCVGRIQGSTLEIYGEMSLDDYADDEGRTVHDRFTVVRGPEPEVPDCDYERYSF